MNVKRWIKARRWTGLVTVVLLLALSTMPGLAQSGPETMNFQGRLLDSSGDPLGGVTRCMMFRMCTDGSSDANCTSTKVWPTGSSYEIHAVTTESGTYKAGLFTVTLGDSVNYTDHPIPPTVMYDSDTLYLEVNISDDGSNCELASYNAMEPRSQVHTGAYAQRSRRVRTVESDDDYIVSVENQGTGGGLHAETESTTFGTAAGFFYADGESGMTYGIAVQNDSTTDEARAGYFNAFGSSGATYGVYAKNDSYTDAATAGYFHATAGSGETNGIYARNDSTSGFARAGYFYAAGDSGQTYGVLATNDSTTNEARAGYFYAQGSSGQTYGVYGENDSSTSGAAGVYGKAGWYNGAVYGVYGYSASTTSASAGVYGFADYGGNGVSGLVTSVRDGATGGSFSASGTSGQTHGLYASNQSTSNYATAGYFVNFSTSGLTYGISAVNNSSTSGAAAGNFHASATTGGYTYGISAQNDSTGIGATAGKFLANASTGTTQAVVGSNNSTDAGSTAGYFYAEGGVAVSARSVSNNIIEAYSSADRRFYVSNSGDVYIDGTYYDTGADFAEMLPAVEGLEPGDVLVVGPDGTLARSTEAYQPTVVGVHSTQPAFVGGSDETLENPGKVPLAVVGVVPVKVSAENGAIRPGDLLTPASLPGHAMRCEGVERCFGRTFGKALEGLEADTGVIQVLVMLQ
jgi:hypothetical protein